MARYTQHDVYTVAASLLGTMLRNNMLPEGTTFSLQAGSKTYGNSWSLSLVDGRGNQLPTRFVDLHGCYTAREAYTAIKHAYTAIMYVAYDLPDINKD